MDETHIATHTVRYDKIEYRIDLASYVPLWEDAETEYVARCFRGKESVEFHTNENSSCERLLMESFFEVAIDYATLYHAPSLTCYGLEIIEK